MADEEAFTEFFGNALIQSTFASSLRACQPSNRFSLRSPKALTSWSCSFSPGLPKQREECYGNQTSSSLFHFHEVAMITRVRFSVMVLGLSLLCGPGGLIHAQEPAPPVTPPDTQTEEQKAKDQQAAEKKATDLLEQLVGEVQMLKLPENRIRVQIAAADMF